MKVYLSLAAVFALVLLVQSHPQGWSAPPPSGWSAPAPAGWGAPGWPAAPAGEGSINQVGGTAVATGIAGTSNSGDTIAVNVSAPEGTGTVSFAHESDQWPDLGIYQWNGNQNFTAAGVDALTSDTEQDSYQDVHATTNVTANNAQTVNYTANPNATVATSVGQTVQSAWISASNGTNLPSGAGSGWRSERDVSGGWGSGSSGPTNGTSVAVGMTVAAQDIASETSSTDDMNLVVAGDGTSGNVEVNVSHDIETEDYHYFYNSANSGVPGLASNTPDSTIVAEGGELMVEAYPSLTTNTTIAGADTVSIAEKPTTGSNLSIGNVVVSDWLNQQNGTGFISGGSGWGSGWKKPENTE